MVEWKIVKLQAVYEVHCENLERILALTNKLGWNITLDDISLTVADILTKYFSTFSWDDFKFKVALKLHNLAHFLAT